MENIQKYFQENPRMFGIAAIVAGIGVFIYAIIKPSKMVLNNSSNRYRVKDFTRFFGEKAGGIIAKVFYFFIAICLIIAGIVYFIFTK